MLHPLQLLQIRSRSAAIGAGRFYNSLTFALAATERDGPEPATGGAVIGASAGGPSGSVAIGAIGFDEACAKTMRAVFSLDSLPETGPANRFHR